MKSMTGFGRGECLHRGMRYTVEITTVNRRNAELIFNLPRNLTSAENLLRDLISPAIARGRATVTVACSAGSTDRQVLDHALFAQIHAELALLQKKLKVPSAPTLSDAVQVYTQVARESPASSTHDLDVLGKATRAAIQSLEKMRRIEGRHLLLELQRLLNRFAKEIAAIRKLAPAVTEDHRQSMKQRLAALDPAFAADDDRLIRELALFADRSDITEEISRLDSHISQFAAGLRAKEASGRSLDFLAQEMFRECNTIGAKANSAAVTRHVIAAKTELERLREQVQNVE
jgi:uncharacterized protein (TIGR00255 family)